MVDVNLIPKKEAIEAIQEDTSEDIVNMHANAVVIAMLNHDVIEAFWKEGQLAFRANHAMINGKSLEQRTEEFKQLIST